MIHCCDEQTDMRAGIEHDNDFTKETHKKVLTTAGKAGNIARRNNNKTE